MLFKVLYTHQKLKKSKTWQDGFMEISPTGRKATLLSEDRKNLDSIFTTIEKIFPDAEFESEKYLIQVEHEYKMEEPKRNNTHQIYPTVPPGIHKVTVKRNGVISKQGSKNVRAFRPPLMDRNTMLQATNRNAAVPLASESAPVHPSLSGKYDTSENSFQSMKKYPEDNASFRNLYNESNLEQKENEANVFSGLDNNDARNIFQQHTTDIMMQNKASLFSGLGNSDARNMFQQQTTDIMMQNKHIMHENASCNYAISLTNPAAAFNSKTNKSVENQNSLEVINSRIHENSLPTVESRIPVSSTSSFGIGKLKNKRSTSEILALFSKKSKQCYRENVHHLNTDPNTQPNAFGRSQDCYKPEKTAMTSHFHAGSNQNHKQLTTHDANDIDKPSGQRDLSLNTFPRNPQQHSPCNFLDESISDVDANISDLMPSIDTSNNTDNFDCFNNKTERENSLWGEISETITQYNDTLDADQPTWRASSRSNRPLNGHDVIKTLPHSSEEFIRPFIKDQRNPSPMSQFEQETFPLATPNDGNANENLATYCNSKDDVMFKDSHSELPDSLISPVFNPDAKENLNRSTELQSKPSKKISSSLIKGAITSSLVRRSELSRSFKVEGDADYSHHIPNKDTYMEKNSFICGENAFLGQEDSPVSNFEVNQSEIPERSTACKRKALTCSPTETLDKSSRKLSPFAFVPTPNLDIQDDEMTMYSDGELCGRSEIIDSGNLKAVKPLARRIGLSKGKHSQTMFPDNARSYTALINGQNSSLVTRNGFFKTTYASSALESGNGEKSMFGELYFPSLDDCETNPTPLRQVRIPVDFKSLSEYKSTFRAALREHLNILLFDLAKNYHMALKKTVINLEFENKLGASCVKQNAPSCPHGECKLRPVRKDGPNKGRLFFCCPGNAAAQCKYFMWADEYHKKTGISKTKNAIVPNKVNLSDINSVNTFFNGQSLAFYCGCTLLKKSRNSFQSRPYRGKGNKWAKASRYEDLDTGKKSLYISLPFKRSSSAYGKDDIWIISKNFSFEPKCTLIAKSTFYGPTSSGEVQITAVSSYSPSNWDSGETVHALLACNAGTELTCMNNLDEISTVNEIPILPHLIFRQSHNQRQSNSSKTRFNCPTLKDAEVKDLISRDIVTQMVTETICQYGLNGDQAGALKAISSMVNQSDNASTESHATLIHGVFGAGKSFLLAVVIVFLVDLFRKNEESSEGSESSWKILISSTTNVAVDRVLQGLLEIGFDDFVRVGSIKKIAKPILPYSVHATGSDDLELKELQTLLKSDLSPSEKMYVKKSIEKHRFGLNRKRLKEVPVVGVTCAASVFPCMDKLSFKIHLLDECSQMTEPLSLLPIARFKCERLILVGDPKQLSPTIQGSEADHKFGLERTLFDRLKQKGHEPILLRTQYRCHPMISAVPNELFYKGQLKNGVTAEQRTPLIDWLNSLCFYNVSKGREKCGNDGSYFNEEEAKFVVFLINSMLLFGIESSQIGVITQYKSQVWKISSLLQEKSCNITSSELRSIQISTVDAFQGAEKEIIMLSCVRTDHVGFIDCDRRTNVALSRAKRHLLIVGNLKMLVRNSLWSKIIDCCERNDNGVVSALKFSETMEPRLNEQRKFVEEQAEDGKKKRKRNSTAQSSQKHRKIKDSTTISERSHKCVTSQESYSLHCLSDCNTTEDKLEEKDLNNNTECLKLAKTEEHPGLNNSEEEIDVLLAESLTNHIERKPVTGQSESDLALDNESEEIPIFFNLL